MPRDGSGIYTYPPGTPGIPDTTIESAKYNGYIADIQQDLNLPRPIVAGGTGATNATAARDNLDAEVRGAAGYQLRHVTFARLDRSGRRQVQPTRQSLGVCLLALPMEWTPTAL